MTELWDLYAADRTPLFQTIQRGQPHPEGTYHIVVSVWVVNAAGQLLLTRRDLSKEQFPGLWEMQGGSVQLGEQSLPAIGRELREETGISADPQEFLFLDTLLEHTAMVDIYALRWNGNLSDLVLQKGETIDARWVALEEIPALNQAGILSAAAMRRFQCVQQQLGQLCTGCQRMDFAL